MFEKMLQWVFHAHLHMRRKYLVYGPTTSVQEFREANKEELNKLYKTLKESYPELGPQHKGIMDNGIATFLIAEGGTYN